MKGKLFILVAAAGCFLLVSGPALAHHGSTAYDMTTLTTVTGTVTDFELINPHSLISIKVKGEREKTRYGRLKTTLQARWSGRAGREICSSRRRDQYPQATVRRTEPISCVLKASSCRTAKKSHRSAKLCSSGVARVSLAVISADNLRAAFAAWRELV